jgi:acyl carrier protein
VEGYSTIKAAAEVAAKIEGFVVTAGRIGEDDTGFSRSVNLFEDGYLDSLGVVRLTAFIEECFDVDLGETELIDPRFTTINGMAEILVSLVGAENLCHQAMFVDDTTGAVMPPDLEAIQVGDAFGQRP